MKANNFDSAQETQYTVQHSKLRKCMYCIDIFKISLYVLDRFKIILTFTVEYFAKSTEKEHGSVFGTDGSSTLLAFSLLLLLLFLLLYTILHTCQQTTAVGQQSSTEFTYPVQQVLNTVPEISAD